MIILTVSYFQAGSTSGISSYRPGILKRYIGCMLILSNTEMKMNYIVSRIEASQDGQPYVYVSYANSNEHKSGANRSPSFNPFGANMMAFTSSEDMMKNLPKAMADMGKAMGGGGFLTDSPTFKISMGEYEDMSIKVGDKVTIEIKKAKGGLEKTPVAIVINSLKKA
jgi:hypothetical protein